MGREKTGRTTKQVRIREEDWESVKWIAEKLGINCADVLHYMVQFWGEGTWKVKIEDEIEDEKTDWYEGEEQE